MNLIFKNMEDFVTYEQAIVLKRLGFNMNVNHYYDNDGELVESLADYNNEDSFNSQETAYDDFNHGYCDEISCSAPTLAQVRKWILDNHKIFITSDLYFKDYQQGNYSNPEYIYIVVDMRRHNDAFRIHSDNKGMFFRTSEDAISAGIDECLKILNNKIELYKNLNHIVYEIWSDDYLKNKEEVINKFNQFYNQL